MRPKIYLLLCFSLSAVLPNCANLSDTQEIPANKLPVPQTWANYNRLDQSALQPWLNDINDALLTSIIDEALINYLINSSK